MVKLVLNTKPNKCLKYEYINYITVILFLQTGCIPRERDQTSVDDTSMYRAFYFYGPAPSVYELNKGIIRCNSF